MFYGLRTAIHRVGELDRAKEWCDAGHPAVLRLGLQPDEPDAARVSTGAVAHWSADDADAAFGRLLELGARGHSGIRTPAAAVWGDLPQPTATSSALSKTRTSHSNTHYGRTQELLLRHPRLLLRFKGSQNSLLETREG